MSTKSAGSQRRGEGVIIERIDFNGFVEGLDGLLPLFDFQVCECPVIVSARKLDGFQRNRCLCSGDDGGPITRCGFESGELDEGFDVSLIDTDGLVEGDTGGTGIAEFRECGGEFTPGESIVGVKGGCRLKVFAGAVEIAFQESFRTFAISFSGWWWGLDG